MSYSNTSSPNQVSSHQNYVSLKKNSLRSLCSNVQILQVLSASGGQVIAIQNPALQMSGHAMPIRAPSTSPNRNEDSKNLVTLLNLSRRGYSGPPAHHPMPANPGANGKDHNNAKKQPTTIIHSDDEEMTFKQEPASPPSASASTEASHRTNGKN